MHKYIAQVCFEISLDCCYKLGQATSGLTKMQHPSLTQNTVHPSSILTSSIFFHFHTEIGYQHTFYRSYKEN